MLHTKFNQNLLINKDINILVRGEESNFLILSSFSIKKNLGAP